MAGKKTGKRLLTWVLVLVMVLSLLPLNVLAAEADEAAALQMSDEDNSDDRSLMPTKDTYTITFNANGGKLSNGNETFKATYNSRKALVKSGDVANSNILDENPSNPPHVFQGWYYKDLLGFEHKVNVEKDKVSDVLPLGVYSRTIYAKWKLPDGFKEASIFYLKDPTRNLDSNTGEDWRGPLGGTTAGFVDTTGFIWKQSATNASVENSMSVQPDDVTWPSGYGTPNKDGLKLDKNTDEWNDIFEAFKTKVEADNGVGSLTEDQVDSITLVPYKVSRGNQTYGNYHVDCDVVIKCNFVTVDFMVKNDSDNFASILNGKITCPKGQAFPKDKVPPAPEKVGYEFDDWYTDDTYATKADFTTALTTDTTFYGKYEPVKTYNVTYTDGVDGEEVFKDQVYTNLRKGADTPAFDGGKPNRAGYEFLGWEPEFADKVSEDVTYTAQWKAKEYSFTVNYLWNGEQIQAPTTGDNAMHGDKITITDTSIDGYTLIPGQQTSMTIGTGENVLNLNYYKNVTLTANSDTVTYDGKEHTVTGYTSAPEGVTFESVSASGSGTDANTYNVTFGNNPVGTYNNLYYVTAANPGTLTINKRSVTLTSASDSKVYDGTALTNDKVTVGGEGFATGEGATYNVTGTITSVGKADNTFTYTLNEGTKATNYTITKTEGKLTITEASAPTPVTINLSDYIKKDLTVIGSGFQGETFTVTVTGDSESGGGQFTGSVTYAANEGNASLKAFTDWKVVHSPTGDNYVFNDNGTITFKKVTTGTAYSFTVDEAKGGTEEMDYDGSSRSFNVWVGTDKESGKLKITKTSKPITLENHYNGTFPVALGQYIKKVYKSECSCAPETTFRFEALIEERVPEANALSLIESVPVEKESKVYTAKGSVTLKAGTEQTADMSIDLPEGIYEVTLKEVNEKTANVKYDKTVYTFEISVFERDGNVKIGFSDVKKDGKEYNEQGFVFTNSYVHRHFIPVNPKPSKPTLNTGDHYAYVMGYPDGTVRPNGSITRAEVSTILFRLLSDKTRDEYFTTESSFTDVKAGAWYNNSIATLEKAGVIVDTAKGGAFRPNEAITRAELAAMLAQFSDAKPVKGVKFSDVSAEHWAYEAIAIAAKMGWIEGYPDGTFRPDATITRAEMMTLVNRALERVPSDEDHLLSKRVMLTFPDCKSGDWFYIAVQEATNSHTYERAATEKNGDEQWTALRANRDWTLLEK